MLHVHDLLAAPLSVCTLGCLLWIRKLKLRKAKGLRKVLRLVSVASPLVSVTPEQHSMAAARGLQAGAIHVGPGRRCPSDLSVDVAHPHTIRVVLPHPFLIICGSVAQ